MDAGVSMMNDILWLMSQHEYHSSTTLFERWCINEAEILDRIVIPHPGSDLIEPLDNRIRTAISRVRHVGQVSEG